MENKAHEERFSREEIKKMLEKYVQQHPEKFAAQLSDEDLDEIVGGTTRYPSSSTGGSNQ